MSSTGWLSLTKIFAPLCLTQAFGVYRSGGILMRSAFLAIAFLIHCSAQTPIYHVERGAGALADTANPVNARDALLSIPYGMAADRAGNIYFHDRNDYVIRRVSPEGVLTR